MKPALQRQQQPMSPRAQPIAGAVKANQKTTNGLSEDNALSTPSLSHSECLCVPVRSGRQTGFHGVEGVHRRNGGVNKTLTGSLRERERERIEMVCHLCFIRILYRPNYFVIIYYLMYYRFLVITNIMSIQLN